MSLALLFHYLLLNMFRMLIHPSSGACELLREVFHGLFCSGSMCVVFGLKFCTFFPLVICVLFFLNVSHFTVRCHRTITHLWVYAHYIL